jgi:hypothetical protein
MNYFKELWNISNKRKQGRPASKLKALSLFLWLFVPILLVLVIITWLDLRLVIGSLIWIIIAYITGAVTIKLAKKN